MSLSVKQKTWITLSIIAILLCCIAKRLPNCDAEHTLDSRYFEVRNQISKHIILLRHQCANGQIDLAQNTLLEIKELWLLRDLLARTSKRQQLRFPADSIITLENLIDRQASYNALRTEIDRLEQFNEVK